MKGYFSQVRRASFDIGLSAGKLTKAMVEVYACCAIDALGIAAMLRQRIDVQASCHHCGTPLAFWADAEGPSPEAAELMVWVRKRGEDPRRVSDSL